MRKQARMPRVTLPSKQANGDPNWVDLRDPDDFMAEDLFKLHRAVRIKQSAEGEFDFSPQEQNDDRVNAFLAAAVTAWSFPAPVPAQNGVAAADAVIGRAMKAKDWAVLRREAQPLMAELEGEGMPDPKSGGSADGEGVPVSVEPAG